ncbi:unnamed protein product [Blepharisma stoltei]|uniref:NAD-dependent epimerase/dehydratase domain-containing protein n=1 Tax=Blepharisma stoltei TaxID=1481888 RepID=A0AAU9JVN7_9CILI|nr:unnamed protein product [Blepharisma stoltei]
MRVFLTGATGAIGSSILDNLLAHGHDVTSAVRSAQKGEEIASKGPHSHFVIYEITLETAHQFEELAAGFDAIIHCVMPSFDENGAKLEDLCVDTLIRVGRKTAETKPVTVVFTSGCLVNGNTNGIMDEDHDDTSRCIPFVVPRIVREKKIVNASSGNFRGVVIRPSWVYGKSFVDQWIRACKSHNKIIAHTGNNHIPFIHYEDLAEMYRILIENHAFGIFYATEPESVPLETVIEKVSTLGNLHEIERIDNPWAHTSGPYGFFIFGQSVDQQIVSKRLSDLYHFTPRHKFLDWINSYAF